MKNRFFFTIGIVGMLSGVALGEGTDGADADSGREWNPYVTLRGGWLFGNFEFKEYFENSDVKQSVESAWSGSAEFGVRGMMIYSSDWNWGILPKR